MVRAACLHHEGHRFEPCIPHKIMDKINLVDSEGKRIGSVDKLEAHTKGELHEAFSIFVFNKNRDLLLQKRALNKYHSGGLWTNTCCSHPRVNENLELAVHRRLQEEMGFDCDLKEIFSFVYRTEKLTNGLIENEFDHVFVGFVDSITVKPNDEEVSDYKWTKMEDLKNDVKSSPENYTEWLKIILDNEKLNNIL